MADRTAYGAREGAATASLRSGYLSDRLVRAVELRSRDSYWTAGHSNSSTGILKIIISELIMLKCYSSDDV